MDIALVAMAMFRAKMHYFIHTQDSGLTGKTSDSFWRYAAVVHKRLEVFVVKKSDKVAVFNPDYAVKIKSINPAAEGYPTWYDPALRREKTERRARSILWIGRLEVPKDPILALRTFEELLKKDPDSGWELTMLGSGTLLENARRTLKSMPSSVQAAADIRGRVSPDAVAEAIALSGIFLMTSHPGYEGYPRVLVEAMSMGAQPVVTKGSDTGALIRNGVNGFMAESRQPAELATLCLAATDLDREVVVQTVESFSAPAMVAAILS
ncbi:glycosyltransferase family 4 protein [Rhodococcoides fascians]|uniref:glycosyltransferase family 4 protein n=1 Tax=Rhodococcoides fascians TaxID=1828 RepID=UPI003CF98556